MSDTPKRIQRKRTRGWKMPENAVSITRPGRFGNPYKIGEQCFDQDTGGMFTITRENCIPLFEGYAKARMAADPTRLEPLRGKDVACFCSLDQACHGDVYLRLANA